MAVYTTLEYEDIASLIKPFGIGNLVSFEGISSGMENTNYFVTSSSTHFGNEVSRDIQGQYVLTIFEELPESHLPFHLQLLDVLANNGLTVSTALRDYNGNAIQHIKGKPALLCTRLYGKHVHHANTLQCKAVGETLAKIHLAAAEMGHNYGGIRDIKWLNQCVHNASALLNNDDKTMVEQLLSAYMQVVKTDELPTGIIHGDMFCDNVMFENDTLTGVIDFYNAGEGYLIFDLAVVVNDWCSVDNGAIDNAKYNALIKGYAENRPFTETEKKHWPLMLKVCAMRFWLSRLLTQKKRLETKHELLEFKDPDEFRRILLCHLKNQQALTLTNTS